MSDTILEQFARMENKIKQLQAELNKAKFVISKFEGWYSDNGCPHSETKEGFCPDREELEKVHNTEMAKLDEDERFGFDPSEDCEHSDTCGYCYARYYEKQFEAKQALKDVNK